MVRYKIHYIFDFFVSSHKSLQMSNRIQTGLRIFSNRGLIQRNVTQRSIFSKVSENHKFQGESTRDSEEE